MNTREMLDTLSRCKFHQRYQQSLIPKPPPPKPALPVIDWKARQMLKNNMLWKYSKVMVGTFLALILFCVVPVMVAYPPYGQAMMLGMPPMMFMAFTWMAGAWWAWDKDRYIFMAATFGAMPIRFTVGLLWAVMMFNIPGMLADVMVFSMMGYWAVFTIIEVAMLVEFGDKLPRHADQVEP